jgi:hypothetical protein
LTKVLAELIENSQKSLTDEVLQFNDDQKEIVENLLVFNNACWTIGEIGQKSPKIVKDSAYLVQVVKTIGEILDQDMIIKKTE